MTGCHVLAALLEQGDKEDWSQTALFFAEGGLFALRALDAVDAALVEGARQHIGAALLEKSGALATARRAALELRP